MGFESLFWARRAKNGTRGKASRALYATMHFDRTNQQPNRKCHRQQCARLTQSLSDRNETIFLSDSIIKRVIIVLRMTSARAPKRVAREAR